MPARRFLKRPARLLPLALGLAATAGLAAGDASCLVPTAAAAMLASAGATSPINQDMSVMRPCKGQVKPVAKEGVEVLFATASGRNGRLRVPGGQLVQDQLATALGPGQQLADIWPERSVLARLANVMLGRGNASVSGASGFESGREGLRLQGDLVPLPGLGLPLARFGWSAEAAVTVSQRGWTQQLQPQGGWLALPSARLTEGELTLEQAGGAKAVLSVVGPADAQAMRRQLQDIDALDTDAARKRLLRAAALQEQQYSVNAVAEFERGHAR